MGYTMDPKPLPSGNTTLSPQKSTKKPLTTPKIHHTPTLWTQNPFHQEMPPYKPKTTQKAPNYPQNPPYSYTMDPKPLPSGNTTLSPQKSTKKPLTTPKIHHTPTLWT